MGVTAWGGYILIMTTNVIKQLDNALLCPGRIDMETDFGSGCPGTIRTVFDAAATGYVLGVLDAEEQFCPHSLPTCAE
ncbi:hypothetical protein ASPFODRAFT_54921 [Aspergillus luchuensis CBS 106.47]|uniref:ATPase AAA-type core domain-containing protein n=1 Tax=Aspergillus luchuensis (strain CBS 106.47) TaxID=1137211 RepID=A0A1M3SYM4_ASPLC|nr:hypothetical protein ASPFODRAFT_54921 [Aspergillus luchuensis CBS 106.47]